MAKKRGFENAQEHDNHIIEKWNSVVTKKDIVWILGDITMEKKDPLKLLDRLNGSKKVVLGNHDRPQDVPDMLKHVNHVCSSFTKKNVIFTHIPIHPQEMNRFRLNVHGHLHENLVLEWEIGGVQVPDKRFINVSCERVDFTPVLLNDLIDGKETKK
ncbi:MAG: hypothetical protein GY827_04790 [Cytophagales bacterium]|nr:hypothetical protein [Cytophagales bacterium]